MGRTLARESAFKLIFSYLFSKEKDDFALAEFSADPKLGKESGYIAEVYNGVILHFDELVKEISKVAEGFKLDRIYKVDLAILLLATYEIKFVENLPSKVSINEALELAKKYSTEQSSKYINGILKNFVGE